VSQKGFNLLEHFTAFQKYIADGSAIPWVVLSSQDNSATSMTHWSTSIESTLRSKVGWTQLEIEEQPMIKALQDFFKYLESEGMVHLYDFDTYEEIQVEAKSNGEAMEKILQAMNHGS
jgi:hypothetical protein